MLRDPPERNMDGKREQTHRLLVQRACSGLVPGAATAGLKGLLTWASKAWLLN